MLDMDELTYGVPTLGNLRRYDHCYSGRVQELIEAAVTLGVAFRVTPDWMDKAYRVTYTVELGDVVATDPDGPHPLDREA